jgi:hypothetical protein
MDTENLLFLGLKPQAMDTENLLFLGLKPQAMDTENLRLYFNGWDALMNRT